MKCHYCDCEEKVSVKMLFNLKCSKCGKKISDYNKKNYSVFSCINTMVCIILFIFISNYGNILKIESLRFEILSFISIFLLRCVFEKILIENLYK